MSGSITRVAGLAAALAIVIGAVVITGIVLAGPDGGSDTWISPEKQALLEKIAKLREEARQQPTPGFIDPAVLPTLGPQRTVPATPLGAGFVRRAELLPFTHDTPYELTNQWYAQAESTTYRIYAGGTRDEPSEGVVVMMVFTADRNLPAWEQHYPLPSGFGKAEITGAEGRVLTLTGVDGDTILFDVDARVLIDAETGVPLPTPSPRPTPTPTPVPSRLSLLAIDADVIGGGANTADSLGARDECAALAVGGEREIDIVVEGAPAVGADGKSGGLHAFQFRLEYDPKLVRVAAVQAEYLLATREGSKLMSFGDVAPDSDGSLLVAFADFGEGDVNEDGSGVLARITLKAVGQGTAVLTLDGVIVVDNDKRAYAVGSVEGARVEAGGACS